MSYKAGDYVRLRGYEKSGSWGFLLLSVIGDDCVGLCDQARQHEFKVQRIERHMSLIERVVLAQNQANITAVMPERYDKDVLRQLCDKAEAEFYTSKTN